MTDAVKWAKTLKFAGTEAQIAEAPMKELLRRLEFVVEIGLGYLSLDRRVATLSGGEMQRLRLAAQLGSGLTGALYVLDEPTVGLHPRDTVRLLDNLRKLARTGSSVLMVEHDADTIRAADYLVDLGPAGGRDGGDGLWQPDHPRRCCPTRRRPPLRRLLTRATTAPPGPAAARQEPSLSLREPARTTFATRRSAFRLRG